MSANFTSQYITTNFTSNLTGSNIGSFSFWAYKDTANGNGCMLMIGSLAGFVGNCGIYSNNSDPTKLSIGKLLTKQKSIAVSIPEVLDC